MDANPAPHTSIASVVGGIVAELGLLAAYGVMLALTLVVVSASAIVYAALALPRMLTQGDAPAPSPERSGPAFWHANPNGGRR